jgi:hypothetical protein
MNQVFSFNRFKLLVLMHWAHNKKRYGLSVLAFMGLLIVLFLLSMLTADDDRSDDVQKTRYFISLFVVGTFYASQYFRDLGSRVKASNFFLIPASTFEKLLCSLMYTVVLFIAVFTAAYYLVDILMLTISNEVVRTNKQLEQDAIINVFKADFFLFREELQINSLLFFLSIHSAFLLGAVYFKKYSFIKTIISGIVSYFLLFGVIYILYHPLFIGDGSEVQIPRLIEQLFGILVMYVIAPILWVLTYYRLKQKQA